MISVSIVIPTFNRATSLQATLLSISKQQGIENVEIIVVDNGSSDDTAKVCQGLSKTLLPQVRYFKDETPGLLTGRHLGATQAMGAIICYLDDDVILNDHWLISVRNAFRNESVQLATGPSIGLYEVEPPNWLQYFWTETPNGKYCHWLSLIDLGNNKHYTHPNHAWGLNFCIRKSALEALDGFHPDTVPAPNEKFQGDGETGLTIKAHAKKYVCLYHSGIRVQHVVPSSRLTVDYFKKRAYFQGICDSYTALRAQHQLSSIKHFSVRDVLRKVKAYALKTLITRPSTNLPPDIVAIQKMLEVERNKGFNFHQNAYNQDEKVRLWVHQKNYWNYKLPQE